MTLAIFEPIMVFMSLTSPCGSNRVLLGPIFFISQAVHGGDVFVEKSEEKKTETAGK